MRRERSNPTLSKVHLLAFVLFFRSSRASCTLHLYSSLFSAASYNSSITAQEHLVLSKELMTKLEAFLLIAKHKQMWRYFQVWDHFTWLRIARVVVTKSVEIDCEQKEGGYLQRRRRQTTAEYCDKISNLRGLRFILVQKWKEYLSLCTFLKSLELYNNIC